MEPNYVIYSASAGSGKTFQLAIKFISICLKGSEHTFKEILAITFTNKAAGEMKSRILNNLYKLSIGDSSENFLLFRNAIRNETMLRDEEITEKSKKILFAILHDFSAFQVLTIDKFFVKVFKSFAADLLISPARKPSIDEKYVKDLAFAMTIDKIGIDREFTEFFKSYLRKFVDESQERSSNTLFDINPEKYLKKIIAKLSNDSSDKLLSHLDNTTYSDFRIKIDYLEEKSNLYIQKIKSLNENVKDLFRKYYIQKSDTSRGTFYNMFFESLSNNPLDIHKCIEQIKNLLTKDDLKSHFNKGSKEKIERYPEFENAVYNHMVEIKNCLLKVSFLDNIKTLSSLLIVLRDAHRAIQILSEEEGIILLNEISRIIHQHIKDERGEFVFEKVGMKFKHIFIDEFQDTSTRQWENLKPLVIEILSVNGSVHIIGDPKQSIYGFRNANSSLMNELMKEGNASAQIPVKPLKKALNINYRSSQTIVEFNNKIFSHIRHRYKDILSDAYQDVVQTPSAEKKGYVEIKSFDSESYEEDTVHYIAHLIRQKVNNGYKMSDILILLRSTDKAKFISNKLINYQFDDDFTIQVTSSDSFLLKENTLINIFINSLRIVNDVRDKKAAVNLLYDLLRERIIECGDSEHAMFENFVSTQQNIFEYISNYLPDKPDGLSAELKYLYKIHQFKRFSVDEMIKIFSKFYSIDRRSDMFLTAFFDLVYEYCDTYKMKDTGSFLTYWDEIVSDTLTINTSATPNAVQVMTIHKAKGLEWPVVILPFFEFKVFNAEEEIIELDDREYGLKTAIMKLTKKNEWPDKYVHVQSKLINDKILESVNLMYVAMTRAKEEMYILFKQNPSSDSVSYYLLDAIKNTTGVRDTITYGQPSELEQKDSDKSEDQVLEKSETGEWRSMLHIAPVYSALNFDKIALGTRMHSVISGCHSMEDFENKLKTLKPEDSLYQPFKNLVDFLKSSGELKKFFESKKVMNERKILVRGQYYVPDAMALDGRTIHILDYKTGSKRSEHEDQLRKYLSLVGEAGYEAGKGYLVYIGRESVEMVEVSV